MYKVKFGYYHTWWHACAYEAQLFVMLRQEDLLSLRVWEHLWQPEWQAVWRLANSRALVAHSFNPSTRNAEAGRSLWVADSLVYLVSSRPAKTWGRRSGRRGERCVFMEYLSSIYPTCIPITCNHHEYHCIMEVTDHWLLYRYFFSKGVPTSDDDHNSDKSMKEQIVDTEIF